MTILKFPDCYDVVIAGGGLAGLCLAIQLRLWNKTVLVIEKGNYPTHRVCGEYVSEESRAYLEDLGIPISELALPEIRQLVISSQSQNTIRHTLQQGGFGISRFTLDNLLYERAKELDVHFLLNTRAINFHSVGRKKVGFDTTNGIFIGKKLVVATGKLPFLKKLKPNKAKKYLGVKYHVLGLSLPKNQIELHNFSGGYLGVSAIEDNKYCICYLAELPKNFKGNIEQFQNEVVLKNIRIKELFNQAQPVFKPPIAMSHFELGFAKQKERDILYIGDAHGTIAPLAGNGMSIAFRTADLATQFLVKNLDKTGQIQFQPKGDFNWRIRFSTFLQSLLKSEFLTSNTLNLLKTMPFLTSFLIRKTYGKPFRAYLPD